MSPPGVAAPSDPARPAPRGGSPAGPSPQDLRTAAAKVLRANDRGSITVAAPELYPHQWSWDAAFVCVGLAQLSVPRACIELDSLLAGQWRTGMIPHIVFSDDVEAPYFPGPEWWRAHELAEAAPRKPRTSGICQPPVHAIGLHQILRIARDRASSSPSNADRSNADGATSSADRASSKADGATSSADRDDLRGAEEFARRAWPALYAWHRWLVTTRRDESTGLIAIVHSWESGLDNSPRWDEPYRAVPTGPLPPYRRRDIGVVADESQRPGSEEYNRYLWLVEELKHAEYDDAAIARTGSFRVGDVFFTAVLAVACEVLADLAEGLTPALDPRVVGDLRRWCGELRAAVAATFDPATGLARDYDIRAGQWVASETVAGFAPLLCGGLPYEAEQRMLAVFDGPAWCGHPDLAVPAPPSTSLASVALDRRRYWRGPLWPVIIWWYEWALRRRGITVRADALRDAGLRLVSDGRFGEYYEPITGEALGSADQSWTAAVALDWLRGVR
ncbi:MAG: MGH1-like glycoside hydrolase domain-containing protein [Micromonosporaceae bacterium]